MTRARDAATNSHVTTYVHPTGAGNQHVPAAGAAGQLLQYASAGTAAWATISTGPDQIVNPNFSNPDSTFTTSGTYSKPANVADDDYMWVFMVGGGGGGGYDQTGSFAAQAGRGGHPLLLYGKASMFHNATYVIGAGGAAGTNDSEYLSIAGGVSSITLHASQGGVAYTVSATNFVHYVAGGNVTIGGTTLEGVFTGGNIFKLESIHTGWATVNTGSDYEQGGGEGGWTGEAHHSVFGGGGGGGGHYAYGWFPTASESFLSGNGGNGSNTGAGTNGALHGGGGGTGRSSAGAGGSGSMRVYYV